MPEPIEGKKIPEPRFKEWVKSLTDQVAEEGDCYGALLWLLEEELGYDVVWTKQGGRA